MAIVRFQVTISILFAWLGTAQAQTASPAIYGALPDVSEVEISPDGQTLAMLHNIDGVAAVFFYDLNNPESQPTGLSVGSTNARSIQWAGNERLLLRISLSERVQASSGLETMEFFRWISISKSTLKAKVLFDNETGYFMGSSGDLKATLPGEPDRAIFTRDTLKGEGRAHLKSHSRLEKQQAEFVHSLMSVNLKTGNAKVVEYGNADTQDWIVDAAGEAVARVDFDRSKSLRNLYVADEHGKLSFQKAFQGVPGGTATVSFAGLGEDPNKLIAIGYSGGDKRGLYEYDLQTASLSNPLFVSDRYDIDSIVYDYGAARVFGARYTDDFARTFHLNPTDQKIQENLGAALPDGNPSIVSRSADGKRFVVKVAYADHPEQFFLFDKASMRLDFVTASYKKLDGVVATNNEKYDYTASDNARIPGYLTAPKGASKRSMPLIVLPHGGPESRSDQAFDWWSSFYAARGYLVYQPNFRGSDGYGDGFRRAGFGEWGRRMQDDITEGVQSLVDNGIVDPNRICIVGASYGGYAALAGATLTPDLYACAVSVNGLSSLVDFLGTESQYGGLSGDYWQVRIGSRFRDVESLNTVSPAKIASRAGAPILLIHARDDVVVSVGQSRMMRTALQSFGKPHEYVELDGEDHWLSSGETRTEMLRQSIEFIDKHIGQ